MNNRAEGSKWEKIAGDFLIRQGYEILEYNYNCKLGEIDIVARDLDWLVFCEVKYRKTNNCGTALMAVGAAKQKKICRVCDFYRIEKHINEDRPIRFDVIAIDGNRLEWIPAAFDYIGR